MLRGGEGRAGQQHPALFLTCLQLPFLQPQAPALLTAQGGNRCGQQLPPSAAAAASRHSFPGATCLARFIPPSPAWMSGDSSWPWPGASLLQLAPL